VPKNIARGRAALSRGSSGEGGPRRAPGRAEALKEAPTRAEAPAAGVAPVEPARHGHRAGLAARVGAHDLARHVHRPGPPVLRTEEAPYGAFGHLSEKDQQKVRDHNFLIERTSRFMELAYDLGIPGWIENPQPMGDHISGFDLFGFPQLMEKPEVKVRDFDQCRYGADSTKPTRLVFWGFTFRGVLNKRCNHRPQKWVYTDLSGRTRTVYQPHRPIQGRRDADGITIGTKGASAYPSLMNRLLAEEIAWCPAQDLDKAVGVSDWKRRPRQTIEEETRVRQNEENYLKGSTSGLDRTVRFEQGWKLKRSYKNVGKKERQAEMFPSLEKEIAAERLKWDQPVEFPTMESRRSEAYFVELGKTKTDRIGGSSEEKEKVFKEVCCKYPEVFWTKKCSPPLVKGRVIHFREKEKAKPVARQPIPLSPYDELRVEFHLEQNVREGKLRKMDPLKEPLPEYATPVFVVDQDAKGLLGRMVCAYGPVNKNLEITVFPSADPAAAMQHAEGKAHHTLVDAIWGYTQFALDDSTKRLLVVCSKSGLYEWQRMPFGPAPAPAEMQSYVHSKFGSMRDKHGENFVSLAWMI